MKPLILSSSHKERTKVLFCENAFQALLKRREELVKRGALIFTDETVLSLYRTEIRKNFGDIPLFSMKPGEKNKSEKTLFSLLCAMEKFGLGRNSVLVGLGGGVVGDVGGLAANLYMRGIEFVFIPTTLLAQADACVGGKTAIDFCGIKNLLGTVSPPAEVYLDCGFLSTLSKREFRNGLGEIVKHGALDPGLFQKLWEHREELFDPFFLRGIIPENLAFKASVVKRDPQDKTGEREKLNLGHTTAHALEEELPLRHGECVLCGLVLEFRIAEKFFPCDAEFGNRLTSLCQSVLGGGKWRAAESCMLDSAKRDKKNTEGKICLIVPTAPGSCERLTLPFDEYCFLIHEAARE